MLVSAIVAVSQNNIIGRDGHLPWHLAADLRHFKEITSGHHILLGRKNYQDINRPLPGRINLVLTRDPEFKAPGCIVCHSLDAALSTAEKAGETELFIIGGAEIYRMAMPICEKLYLTRVLTHIDGDVEMPPFGEGWVKLSEVCGKSDEKNDFPYAFQVFERHISTK
jgi:dihydrofolate reductase